MVYLFLDYTFNRLTFWFIYLLYKPLFVRPLPFQHTRTCLTMNIRWINEIWKHLLWAGESSTYCRLSWCRWMRWLLEMIARTFEIQCLWPDRFEIRISSWYRARYRAVYSILIRLYRRSLRLSSVLTKVWSPDLSSLKLVPKSMSIILNVNHFHKSNFHLFKSLSDKQHFLMSNHEGKKLLVS